VTRKKGKNTAESVRVRLLALAQSKGEDYQRVLGRYAIERFLYRLGQSPYRDKFALKGATLFTLWTGQTHRPTKDVDLLGRGSSAIGDVKETRDRPNGSRPPPSVRTRFVHLGRKATTSIVAIGTPLTRR
jgi:hypothetical protein